MLKKQLNCKMQYRNINSTVHVRMASCTCKSSVQFDKTWLWFGFTFVPLFTAPTPSQSRHNS